MTHTLHRAGDLDSLRGDFVVFTMSAKTVNAAGSAVKMKEFLKIVEKHNPVNFGDMKTGNIFNTERDVIFDSIRDTSIVHSVFTDRETVSKVIAELKAADLGTSVVISGLVDETDAVCKENDLAMHTVEYSGGIHGRTDKLPMLPVLEVTTMCGHGMVASNLVAHLAGRVKKGKMTLEEAGRELAKPCQCGVFNPERAAELVKKIVDQQ